MAKINLTDIASGPFPNTVYNANNALIEAFTDNSISRDGTAPNTMQVDLDVDGNKIINVGPPSADTDAARLVDITGATALGEGILPSTVGQNGRVLTVGSSDQLTWRTAFVGSQVISVNYTPTQDNINQLLICSNTITISMSDLLFAGHTQTIRNIGSGVVAITPLNAARQFAGIVGGTFYVLPGNAATVIKDSQSNYHILSESRISQYAHAYNDTNQVLGNNSNTPVDLNNELHDPLGFHDNVTNNNRLTVPSNMGIRKIRLSSNVSYQFHATGRRLNRMEKTAGSMPDGRIDLVLPADASVGVDVTVTSPILDCGDGDYYEIECYQNSGGNLNLNGGAAGSGSSRTWFNIEVIEQAVV